MYVVTGFSRLDNWPFPKSQFQKVGLPVLVLLKLTTKGAQPAESEIVKSATGACPKSLELVSNKRITHALAINSDVFSVTDLLFSLN